jgi:preprotein translocase subunit SecD
VINGGVYLVIELCDANTGLSADCPQIAAGNLSSDLAETVAVLRRRAQLSHVLADVNAAPPDLIEVHTNMLSQGAAILFGATARMSFATPIMGPPPGCDTSGSCDPTQTVALLHAPDVATQTFLTDQDGLYDPNCELSGAVTAGDCQFQNSLDYPPGYHWKIDETLSAADIAHATAGTDATTGQASLDINFSAPGAAEWQRITEAAYLQYESNANSPLAEIGIFLDRNVLSAPFVTQGGQSSETQITGSFDASLAATRAIQLNAGTLPDFITDLYLGDAPYAPPTTSPTPAPTANTSRPQGTPTPEPSVPTPLPS